MSAAAADIRIVVDDVSRFYGEVLAVNRVSLAIGPGITSLVGPNGAGKTTLLNLITGLVRPTRGRITVFGIPPTQPHRLLGRVGYATQFDAFPRGLTGLEFLCASLRLFGIAGRDCRSRAMAALERVGLREAARRKLAAYSKGMRQRIRLAQVLAHDPEMLILDEPLNGLDPLVRAEIIVLFRRYADAGRTVVVSSHVLHEVDQISDQVVLMTAGYVVAEGQIQGVRQEIRERPLRILVHCDDAPRLAAEAFARAGVVGAQVVADGRAGAGLLIQTREPDRFYRLLNRLAVRGLDVQSVRPTDDTVDSLYDYLIGQGAEGS